MPAKNMIPVFCVSVKSVFFFIQLPQHTKLKYCRYCVDIADTIKKTLMKQFHEQRSVRQEATVWLMSAHE